jgi:hypothetical protein
MSYLLLLRKEPVDWKKTYIYLITQKYIVLQKDSYNYVEITDKNFKILIRLEKF